MRRFLPLLALAATSTASAVPPLDCYTGYAYHADSDALAYTARYRPVEGSEGTAWHVVYRDSDGATIGSKTMDFSHHDFVAVARLEMARSGDIEGIQRDPEGDWRMVRRDGDGGELQVEPFEIRERMAASNGIHPFTQAHFESLLEGETVHFDLVVANRLEVLPMSMSRIADTTVDNERAVRFRAKVDMLFVNWFADDLELTYHPETKRLLEYTGPSDVQHKEGKPFPVRIRYRRDDPPEAAPAVSVCSG